MSAIESPGRVRSYPKPQTLLLVGPQPPPWGGATTTFQTFLDETTKHLSIRALVINTAPPASDYRKKTFLLSWETLRRMLTITKQYQSKIKNSDAVLVFANSTFIFTLGAILLLLARWYHKPFYFKPFGGSLDLRLTNQKLFIKNYLLSILRPMNGILVQTQQIQAGLAKLGCANIYYFPGYRPLPKMSLPEVKHSPHLRLIFLSHLRHEKGPLILLEALRLLAQESNPPPVTCDFYGPIFDDDRAEFLRQLAMTPGAQYCGVVEVGAAPHLIATYDVLVLPTYFIDEGHSGTIIEAMQVGVPIISTQFRAIPELVIHGENGLLVPPQDSQALAEAIQCLAADPALRQRMGASSYRQGQKFRADVVVSQILDLIFPK